MSFYLADEENECRKTLRSSQVVFSSAMMLGSELRVMLIIDIYSMMSMSIKLPVYLSS